MRISDQFTAGKTLFGFELLPPLKGRGIGSVFEVVERLLPFGPSYMNITYHREEVQQGRLVRKRPGTMAVAGAVHARYPLEVVPHLICGGATPDQIEDALIDLQFLGIENVLALRGDPPRGGAFPSTPQGHAHACDLVAQIAAMNRGRYLDPSIEAPAPSRFCIGVAGYPEKHAEAASLQEDIARLKAKVDAGADYVVTQLFFDNARYFDFVEACRRAGITVPIVAGIKPISSLRHLDLLPGTFQITLPDELLRAARTCRTDADMNRLGVEWAVAQGRELIAAGVPALHFYTMGRAGNIEQIARELF